MIHKYITLYMYMFGCCKEGEIERMIRFLAKIYNIKLYLDGEWKPKTDVIATTAGENSVCDIFRRWNFVRKRISIISKLITITYN